MNSEPCRLASPSSPVADLGGHRPPTMPIVACRPQLTSGRATSGRVWVSALVLCALTAGPAAAQPRGTKPPKPAPAAPVEPTAGPPTGDKGKPKVFDFTGLDLAGRLRTPQLLYFLDRASEELERASLEKRSFIPAMVRSIDEHDL